MLAAVFRPGTAPSPNQAQRWLSAHGRSLDALVADISAAERDLSATLPPSLGALRHDLVGAGRTPPPPGALPRKAWAAALERTGAAIAVLQAGAATPVEQAAARDDLAAAADGLVAVMQAAGGSAPFYPH